MNEKRRLRVVAAILVRDGRLLIAQRSSTDSFPGKWEFPGGKVHDGERDEEALAREIDEELGVSVEVESFWRETVHDYPSVSVHVRFFRCRLQGNSDPVAKQHAALAWVTFGDLGAYDFLEADRPILNDLRDVFSS